MTETSVEEWLAAENARAVNDLAGILDVEAGLREVLETHTAPAASSDPGSGT